MALFTRRIKAQTTKERDFIDVLIVKRALPSQVHCNPIYTHIQVKSHLYAICKLLGYVFYVVARSLIVSIALDVIVVLLSLVTYDDTLRYMSQKRMTLHE